MVSKSGLNAILRKKKFERQKFKFRVNDVTASKYNISGTEITNPLTHDETISNMRNVDNYMTLIMKIKSDTNFRAKSTLAKPTDYKES